MTAETRSSREAEHRTRARDKVREGAARGDSPSLYRPEDLAWAFGETQEADRELVRLEEQAEAVRVARREQSDRTYAGIQLRHLAEQILREWDRGEKADRMERAMAEARRRLGTGEHVPAALEKARKERKTA
jgi:hypothetical protein